MLDDRPARTCARALGVPVIGTVGVLVLANRAQLVPLIRPLVDDLIGNGLRVSDDVVAQALVLAGG